MKTLLVEFKFSDSWDAYTPNDEEKISDLIGCNPDGVEVRIIKDYSSEMREDLKEILPVIGTGISISLDESDLREFIEAQNKIQSLLKELES